MTRSYSTHEKNKEAYRILDGRPGATRPPKIPRRRREDNIKIDLYLGRDHWSAILIPIMNLSVP
jgi:hypothetical protein